MPWMGTTHGKNMENHFSKVKECRTLINAQFNCDMFFNSVVVAEIFLFLSNFCSWIQIIWKILNVLKLIFHWIFFFFVINVFFFLYVCKMRIEKKKNHLRHVNWVCSLLFSQLSPLICIKSVKNVFINPEFILCSTCTKRVIKKAAA